jgi:hypothetical protein
MSSSLDRLQTLEDVLAWCRAHRGNIVDVVVQDEFTHDVVVEQPHGFLVFDST